MRISRKKLFDGALNSKQASTESLGETAGTIINHRTVYGKQNDLLPPLSARGGGVTHLKWRLSTLWNKSFKGRGAFRKPLLQIVPKNTMWRK